MSVEQENPPGPLVLVAASTGCSGGSCPSVYKSEDGRFFVQGFRVSSSVKVSVSLPEAEDLVEIGEDLIKAIKEFS